MDFFFTTLVQEKFDAWNLCPSLLCFLHCQCFLEKLCFILFLYDLQITFTWINFPLKIWQGNSTNKMTYTRSLIVYFIYMSVPRYLWDMSREQEECFPATVKILFTCSSKGCTIFTFLMLILLLRDLKLQIQTQI